MVKEWDNDGAFEDLANIEIDESDLEERDPFDISRALEGAALEHLNPEVKRLVLHSKFEPSGDQPKAIEKLITQLENGQERAVLARRDRQRENRGYAMAPVIQHLSIPARISSHNQTLGSAALR